LSDRRTRSGAFLPIHSPPSTPSRPWRELCSICSRSQNGFA